MSTSNDPPTLDLSLVKNAEPEDIVDLALNTVRNHLGMEIAYLSEFVEGRSVFRAVSAPGLEHLIKPGDSQDLQDVYCQHILDGRLPKVIPDTKLEPLAMSLPITTETPIGSHVSVPVLREDGELYGMFCCLSPSPKPSLNARDLEVMETFAGLAKTQLHASIRARDIHDAALQRIETVIESGEFEIALQPIFQMGAAEPYCFEALCRFAGEPYQPPNIWFAEALFVDKQLELELKVISVALNHLNKLPDHVSLSVNASPATVVSGRLPEVFDGYPLERLVLEVTEHAVVDDYKALEGALQVLAFKGVRIAIDDVGAGYSGLSHILQLRPNVLKLDLALTRDIDKDLARQSLVKAMVFFAQSTDALVVAEGIETKNELSMLASLGVELGQGYFLGRPGSLKDAMQLFSNTRNKKLG